MAPTKEVCVVPLSLAVYLHSDPSQLLPLLPELARQLMRAQKADLAETQKLVTTLAQSLYTPCTVPSQSPHTPLTIPSQSPHKGQKGRGRFGVHSRQTARVRQLRQDRGRHGRRETQKVRAVRFAVVLQRSLSENGLVLP